MTHIVNGIVAAGKRGKLIGAMFARVFPRLLPSCSHVGTILGCYNGLCAQPTRYNSTVPVQYWYITLWKGKRL